MLAPKKVKKSLNIVFNAQVSENSMGGGDKIVISIAKELQKSGFTLNFIGSPEGVGLAKIHMDNCGFTILNNFRTDKLGFFKTYILRILFSPVTLFRQLETNSVVWSASDFLPDVLPAFWVKLAHRDTYWIGNMFLRARNPFKQEVDKNSSTILYYYSQKIALFLCKLLADKVCVLCQEDFDAVAKYFGSPQKVCLISGGIDCEYLDSIVPNEAIHYDACYIGRLHYQKGLPTLIKVWTDVNNTLGNKHLAIIGWGNAHEVAELSKLCEASGYKDNIHLLGFMDGDEKLKVLKSSTILLFPSSFESWGVVVAEALGCGVPVVAFNLPQIRDNFKAGVLWSQDYPEFVKNTVSLLADHSRVAEISSKAYEFSKKLDWKYSAEKFTKDINY